MAKRHSKRKKKTSRRRRVGALALNPNSTMVKLAGVAVGFLMADKINTALDKVIPTNFDKKLVGASQGGLGTMLLLKKQSSPITTIAAGVLAGSGAKRLMTEFGIGSIGNYGRVPVVNGYPSVPVIGNKNMGSYLTNNQSLAGGYRTRNVNMETGSSALLG